MGEVSISLRPSPESYERPGMHKTAVRGVVGLASLVLLGVAAVVGLRSSQSGTPEVPESTHWPATRPTDRTLPIEEQQEDGSGRLPSRGAQARTSPTAREDTRTEDTAISEKTESKRLRFPSEAHSLRPTDSIEDKYDEFTNVTTTSIMLKGFAGTFEALSVYASRDGQSPAGSPSTVEIAFLYSSRERSHFEFGADTILLLDGRRVPLGNLTVLRETKRLRQSESEKALEREVTDKLAANSVEGKSLCAKIEAFRKQKLLDINVPELQATGDRLQHIVDSDKQLTATLHRVRHEPPFEEEEYWYRMSTVMSIPTFLDIVNADTVRGRVCKDEFSISSAELDALRSYASRLAPH